MPDLRRLQALEQQLLTDPEFALLDYKNQMYVRLGKYTEALRDDQEFQQLDARNKQYVLQELTVQTPGFKDKELQRYVAELSARFKQEAARGEKPTMKAEDAPASNEMLNFTLDWRMSQHSALFNVISNKLLAPLIHPMTGVAETRQMQQKEEAAKVVDYFDILLSQDKRMARMAGVSQALVPIAGELLDTAVLYSTLAGSLAAPKGLGKLAISAGKAISNQAQTLAGVTFGNLVGSTLHAAVGGFIGLTQNMAQDALNRNSMKDSTFQEILFNNAKYFGGYFLGDVIFNTIAGVVAPFAKQLSQSFLPGKARGQVKSWLNIGDLTEHQFGKLVDDLVGLKTIDKQLLARLPQETQEVLMDATQRLAVFSNVRAMTNVDEVFKTLAFAKGYMVRSTEAGWKVRPILGKTWKNFSSLEKTQQFILDQLDKLPSFSTEAAATLGAATRQGRIQQVLRGVLKEGAEGDLKVLTRLIAPVGGEFDAQKVKAFSQAYLKARGVSDEVYRSLKTFEEGGDIVLEITKSRSASIPKQVKKSADELTGIRKIVDALESRIKEPGIKATQGKKLAQHLQRQYGSQLREQQLYSPAWARHAAEIDLKAQVEELGQGAYRLTLPDGSVEEFESIAKLGQRIVRQSMTDDMLASFLAREQGLQLKRLEGGGLKVYRGKQPIAEAADLDQLLTKHPELLPKIPDYLGPELTFVDDRVRVVNYVRSTAVGRYDQLFKHLDSFYQRTGKRSLVVLSTKKGGSLRLYQGSKHLEAYVPEIGHRQVFNNIKEAKEYLHGGWSQWDELAKAATAKGMRVVPYKGRYLAWGQGRNIQLLNTSDDLHKALAAVPTPEYMPELSGLSPDITMNLPKPDEGMFTNMDLLTPPDLDLTSPALFKGLRGIFGDRNWIRRAEQWHISGQALYRPPDAYLRTLVERGMGDEFLLKAYHGIEDSLATIRAEDWKLQSLVNGIWRRNNRWLPRALRQKIGQYMDTPEAAKAAKAIELGLKPEDIEVAVRARAIYGSTAENGLAGRFSIDPEIFQSDYLSRIRKFYVENPQQMKGYYAGETKKFIKDAFGGTPPRDLDAFFKHLRVNEVAQLAMETDPLKIMTKYVRVGNREMILGPFWKQVDNYVKANLRNIDPLMLGRFELYRSQVMGISQGVAEKLIEVTHGHILKQMGLTDKALNRDFIKMGMSWTYLSAMGGRPWLVVRNSFQIGTTLDPRIGGNYTAQAIRDLGKDKAGDLYNALRNKGVLMSQLPIPGGELIDLDTLTGKLTHAGLRWYRNSDEFTRAVAYRAAQLRFQDAAKKYTSGVLGAGDEAVGKFVELSGLGMEPPHIRNQARQLIAQGQWGPAEALFASRIVDETMFVYRAGNSPVAFRGMIGRIFGMMGTYPAYYVENIRRALKYASTGQKLAYATRFVGNSMAFYYGFKALGVNATNFLPWVPATFGGGPIYGLMNQTLAAMDTRGYKGRQARAEVFGIKSVNGRLTWQPVQSELFGRWMPTFMVRGVAKAVGMMNQGDAWGAFLTATGFPYRQELLEDMTVQI